MCTSFCGNTLHDLILIQVIIPYQFYESINSFLKIISCNLKLFGYQLKGILYKKKIKQKNLHGTLHFIYKNFSITHRTLRRNKYKYVKCGVTSVRGV